MWEAQLVGSPAFAPQPPALHANEDDAAYEPYGASDADRTDGMNGNPKYPELVEGDRSEHLVCDEQGEEGCSA